jgi:hypothetical protein
VLIGLLEVFRGLDKDVELFGRLKPEDRVNLAIGMSDVCVRVCADGVKYQNQGISEEELIERVWERLMFGKKCEK